MIQLLREKTKHLHKELEKRLYADKIMNKSLTKSELTHLTYINYLYFSYVESLTGTSKILNRFISKKSNKAYNDLILQGKTNIKSWKAPFNELLHEDYFIGMAYVTLGSTLGAKVIEKKLDLMEHFQTNEYTFYSFDPEEYNNWSEFLGFLQVNEHHLNQEAVVNGATTSFQHFFTLYDFTK